ncbi:MAG: hypothetical protein ACRDMZ_04890, partial [Solirubrobacteraceae bacterium]
TVSDPVDRATAARAADAISRATAFDHPLPGAYALVDPLLPTWTDVLEDYARCRDAVGHPIACDAPTLPGDVAFAGHRRDREWQVERAQVPDEPLDPVCRSLDDAAAPALDADPHLARCNAPSTIATDPDAVSELALISPPALYLNAFGWDLTTGSTPPATLFYIDDPAYLALELSGPPDTDWAHAVRAMIGLEPLRLVSIADTADGVQLRFACAPHPGLQVAFLAFGPDTELDRPRSRLQLRSIRWRDEP